MKTTTHYEIGDELAPRRAVKDIQEYLENPLAFNEMIRMAESGASFEDLASWWGFAGVEGYPVRAFYFLYSPNPDKEQVVL